MSKGCPIRVALPLGVTYQEGDHLGIIPENTPAMLERVLRRYRLNGGDDVVIKRKRTQCCSLAGRTSDQRARFVELLRNRM